MSRYKIQTRTRRGQEKYTALYAVPGGGYRSAGTFTVRDEAVAAAVTAAAEVGTHDWSDPQAGEQHLDHYVTEVWLHELPGHIEITTYRGYVSTYNNHIKPVFGGMPIARILQGHEKKWISEMETGTGHYTKPVGRHTQHKAHRVLALILSSAKENKVLRGDLATDGKSTRPLPAEDKDVKALTPAQYHAIFAKVPEHWKPLVQTAVDSGMRLNELRALSLIVPDRFDWEAKKIRVAPGIVQVTKKEGTNGSRFKEKAYPKGRKKRWAQLGSHGQVEDTMGLLLELIDKRGLEENTSSPIFTNPSGGYISSEAVEEMWEKACKEAGVSGFAFKHLRSTCASWDLQQTGDIMFVKNKMGHASVTTTEKHYLNVIPKDTESDSTLTSLERFRAKRKAAAS